MGVRELDWVAVVVEAEVRRSRRMEESPTTPDAGGGALASAWQGSGGTLDSAVIGRHH